MKSFPHIEPKRSSVGRKRAVSPFNLNSGHREGLSKWPDTLPCQERSYGMLSMP
jgi:hypothetical protein